MYITHHKDIGALIKDRRTAKGMTQGELAAKLGVRLEWVSNIERGKHGSRLDLVLGALNVLNVRLWADIGDGAPIPGADDGRRRNALDMNQIIDDMLDDL